MKKLFLFAATMLMSSCVYSHMYHFEDGDLEWMDPYEAGDVIAFETSTGTDRLYITEKKIYDQASPFLDNEGQEWFGDYYANAVYVGYFIHNNSKHDFCMIISKRSDGGLEFYNHLMDLFSNEIKITKDTIVVDTTNANYKRSGPQPDNCESFKWSKKEGLIEYRLRDGTIYPSKE